ncbi:two-component system sensor histidine kinase NtrB [Aquibacillus halophilus]|nr:ATP-binding protein [Aquibacillus halophilus]
MKTTKSYILITLVLAGSLFYLHNVHSTFLEIANSPGWLLTILLVCSIVLANQHMVILPPYGNALSMDSSIYLASVFIFGLEITLVLLFLNSIYEIIFQRKSIWWKHVFNFAMYTMMISGSYYLFVFLGGEEGYINAMSSFAYLLSLIGYFLINVILMGIYFWTTSSSSFNLLELIYNNSIIKSLVEVLPNYIVTLALAFVLGILLEAQPIFGLVLFVLLMILLSLSFKKHFNLFENVSNDRTYREQIMNSVLVGIVTIDEKSTDISLNSSAISLLDVTQEKLKEIMLGNFSEQSENKEFWRILRSKEVVQNIKVSYKKGPKTLVLLVSQSELKNNSNEVIGRVCQLNDITERHQLEKRMHQSEKLAAVGELFAGAAHEIRNPLTVIQGFLTLMKNTFSEKENSRYHVPFMLNELDRINTIAEEMLMLAKPGEIKLEQAFIKDIIEEIIHNYNPSTFKHDIQIETDLDDTQLLLDPKQIKQVMYNLIRNSSEAVVERGTILIYSKKLQDTYQLYIRDTGTGIPTDIQQVIFDPFLTDKDNGTGLGLSIVQRIIENHKGKVELFSSSESGTTFLITLPLPPK